MTLPADIIDDLDLSRDWSPDAHPRDSSGKWAAVQTFADAANAHLDRSESDARRTGRRMAMRARQEYGFIRNRKPDTDDPDADGRTADAQEAITRASSDTVPGWLQPHFAGEPADAVKEHLIEHGVAEPVPDDVWASGVDTAREAAANGAHAAGLKAVPVKYHAFLDQYESRVMHHAQSQGRIDPRAVFARTDERSAPEEMGLSRSDEHDAIELSRHSYSSTQINLPPELSAKVLAMAHEIPDEDLAEDGRSGDPHVTALYGLHTGDPDDVATAVAGEGPVSFKVGGASIFPANDKRPSDVVKLDIDSPDLHRINGKLQKLPNGNTYPKYEPHCTLAYVKPGKGKQYAAKFNALKGSEGKADRLRFSDPDGMVTDIPMGDIRLSRSEGDDGGHWITIDGTHVRVKNGRIVAGPSALVGHKPEDHGHDGKPDGTDQHKAAAAHEAAHGKASPMTAAQAAERGGHKLHLATDKPEEVSSFLKQHGLAHKVGHSGQEGKDVTVYVGHKDAADAAANLISEKAGHLLKQPHGETLADDRQYAPKVMGRFDAPKSDDEIHQYGSQGVPYLKADVNEQLFGTKRDAGDLRSRAKAVLSKKYGAFFHGSQGDTPDWVKSQQAAGKGKSATHLSRLPVYDREKRLWLRRGDDAPRVRYDRDKKIWLSRPAGNADYFREIDGHPVPFYGTPGSGTMALPKRPHDEEKHPRTHGGRFDKKPTHSYDREKKKWVAVTEGPGEISPEKPAGEVKPDAGPPVVKPDAVKVHSAKEHEARVMGEAKQAEQKPATAAHLGMVQDQYVLPGTEKAVAEAMENEAQASRLIRGAGVHQDIALKAIREGKEVAAKHASNPEMKAKDVADEVEGAFREAGVTADHPKVRQAAESLAGTAIAKGTSEGTRKNTPGKINRQLNGEVLTHEELKAEAADFADKRATGRELANKLQHTEDKASVTNWGSNYLPQSGRLASNAITTIDTESATNPNFATSLKNRSKDGFKRLAHADVEREFSSAAVKARENPPLRDAGVFHGGANAQPARHFVTHDGQTVAVDEGQHAILKKATGFDELRESSGKSGSPIVAYRGGKPVGMIKGGASPYGVEAGHTVAPSPTNSLGEPVSPFVASLKAGQPAAATTVRKPPRQDETKQQQRDRARKERPEADRIAAQANAEFDARMQAKTAPTPFQPPADFHTAEAARHAALATDHRKKGDFAAAADASAKSLSHRKQAAALKGEPLSVPANPAQDREGARAEPAAEPANATTTPAAGKPSTGHGGHPDTKLTLWQDHATGKQRVYLNHPSLRPFGTGGKRAIAAYIHEGPGGKLELHQHGTQFPEREAQQIAAPLLAKHQTMESLAAHATVGKSAKEYASSAWKQYLPQGAENQTGTAAEYQRATAAHEQRVTALVKKDSPRLSHLEATREAKRRIFKATERSLHEFRQNDGLPLSRSLADAEIPDGVLVFSVSGLGEVSESPAMGQNRPKEVNGIPARYYWKKMLAPGVIHHPDPKVGLVNVTPEDIRAIDKNTRDWIKTEGGKPRVPPTHKGTTTNYGWIIDTKVDENGTLCGLHQLIGSDAHQAAARNESSVGLRRNFKSGRSGRTFSLLLEHNAIVSDPVQEGLGNFIPLSRTIAA